MSLIYAFGFVLGAVIGSFLSAAIWRMHVGESLARGRSKCPHCRHQLGVSDLVPVFSYLALRGRCRYCFKRIHPAYFFIELATGLAFVLVLAATAADLETAQSIRVLAPLMFRWALAAVLMLLFVYDLLYLLVPRDVALVAAAVAFVGNAAQGGRPTSYLLGALLAGGFFYAQYAFSKGRWIGSGDIFLGLFMGAALGAELTLLAMFLAYVSGAAVGLLLMARGRATMKTQVPFGTFLMAATFVSMLYGDGIIAWYVAQLL
ncbi:prepilin peptidase [Candidatus Uhrbacteria bacterium]|nr:prepilin peptidase [Candidatus Uhrbacteria bacterium]